VAAGRAVDVVAGLGWVLLAAGLAVKVSGPFWPQAVKVSDANTRINGAARVERPDTQAGPACLATLTVKPC
jgi:hypothetical protein